MRAMLRALSRFGGVLVAPRASVRALHPDEGERDGLWLGLLYLAAVGVPGLVEGAADLAASRNFNGVLMLLAALGRVLIVPIVVLVGCETILGRARAHRSGVCLVPTVAAAALLRELPVRAWVSWPFATEVFVAALALAMAFFIRDAIAPRTTEDK